MTSKIRGALCAGLGAATMSGLWLACRQGTTAPTAVPRLALPDQQSHQMLSAAAVSLRNEGSVVLTSCTATGLLDDGRLRRAAEAEDSLRQLLDKVSASGRDPEDEFEFAEICHRSFRRYDVSCPPGVMCDELSQAIDNLAVRIISEAYADAGATLERIRHVCDGIVTSLPGARAQQFHTDGPRGLVTAFIPLVDCEHTGTELWLGSHVKDSAELIAVCLLNNDSTRAFAQRVGLVTSLVRPKLRRGDILLFDYQTIHRGSAHPEGTCARPMMYR